MTRLLKTFLFFFVFIGLLASFTSHSFAGNFQMSPKMEKKLKCKDVPKSRWQVCGDSNFKNKVVVGFGIHFSKVDPKGQHVAVGSNYSINRDAKSCDALMSEKGVSNKTRRNATKVCKEMFAEHQAHRFKAHKYKLLHEIP